jgi:amino acid adenylation domain-containing protein
MQKREGLSSRRTGLTAAQQALLEKWKQGQAAERPASAVITRRERPARVPLSFAQRRLWFLDQLVPGSVAYNIPATVRLTGRLDVDALERSLDEVTRRHETLRTVFAADDGEPSQVVLSHVSRSLPTIDLRALPESEQAAEVERLARAEAERPFDLARGPLLRATLLKLGEETHVFLLTMHHIVSDGWSMNILVRELAAAYGALSAGRAPSLPELPIQYADFAVWQREWLQRERLEAHLAYWKKQLSGSTPVLELPSSRPRPAIQTFQGRYQKYELPASLSQTLKSLAALEGVSLFVLMLAAFKTLLHRYTQQDDIIVGTPMANRSRVEVEGLIGFFANTLVLRSDLSGDPSFRELLRRVREVVLSADAYQDMPFEQLVELLQPKRDMSRNPLFQVMFIQDNTASSVRLPNLSFDALPVHSGTTKFDLSLSVTEREEGLCGSVEYSTDIFDDDAIARFVTHYRTLLAGVAADPDRQLSQLPVLAPDERQQILFDWNDTAIDFSPRPRLCLHQLIEEQAARTPEAIAVHLPALDTDRDEDEQLTYGELDARANKLARHLREMGVGPESLVGICVRNSLEMVFGLLGILKAGAAYVPLDPTYPRERLAFMLEDSQVSVLLSQQHLVETLPEHGARVVLLDSDWAKIERHSGEKPNVELDPQNSAYVIYTSGSTGRPKGAINSHYGICNRLLWMQQAYQLDESDRVLQKTPFSFDVSVWEFFWPLLAGARMVVARPEGHKDSAYLARLIAEQKVTVLHFVPSMLQVFLEENLDGCDSLRHVICSGEELPLSFQERFHARLRAQLHNLYGPTEAAIDVTFWDCSRESRLRSIPIGRPIANTRIHILDRHLNPVPVGVPGELHIGGVQLARGYLRRPSLTAERFIPDPFTAEAGGRLYKTGDLARYRPDGNIEYLGRLDYQVKIRGCRIELGEIESALRSHEAVRDAVVLERDDRHASGHKQLVAYLIPDSTGGGAATQFAETTLSNAQFAQWQEVFERTYDEGETPAEAALNLAGWTSSYTGEPLPPEEMREWAERTSERILALRPERALEIGCGTGLLLFRIAPHCALYCGTDFSRAALEYVRRQLSRSQTPLPQVRLWHRMAHELEGLPEERFDTVILNSVVQYFPGVNYLLRVLEGAARLLKSGVIFIGDVRSRPLLEAFHASVELERASDTLSMEQLRQRVRRRVEQENELVIDPELFFQLGRRLPHVTRVEVQLKRGRARNELTRFRYDVCLYLNVENHEATADEAWLDWREQGLTLDSLRRILREGGAAQLRVANVPDERLRTAVSILDALEDESSPETVGGLRRLLRDSNGDGEWIDPEQVWALGEETGHEVVISPSNRGRVGSFDLLFTRRGAGPVSYGERIRDAETALDTDWQRYANNPSREMLAQQLLPELRRHLKERLPDYMMPASFVLVDEWPLTPNGKLDRQALPAPTVMPEMEAGYVAPRTSVEMTLADIWEQVLRLTQVGIHDNFFELGGDSIHSIQVVARAAQAGLRLSPRHLFQHQTIAELAELATTTAETAATVAVSDSASKRDDYRGRLSQTSIALAQVEDVYPVTPMQEHMLYQRLHAARPGLYVVHHAFSMRSVALDARAFEEAWQKVIERHQALRTSFAWRDLEEPLQVVYKEVKVRLEQEDWRQLSEAEQDARLASFETEARRRGFDLNRAPHTRLALFRLSDDAYYFVYVFHLMLQDGWSYSPIMKEVFTFYETLTSGRGVELEPAEPYRDYIEWARRQDMTEAEQYWLRRLGGASLPTPHLTARADGRPSEDESADKDGPVYRRESLELSPELTGALASLAKQRRLTLYTLVQGAWALLLSRYGDEPDVVFGSVVSGRATELKGIEHRIGLYFNILPVRACIDAGATLLSCLSDLQTQNVEMGRYQYTPLSKIHEWLGVPRERPLFDSYLVFENFPVDPSLAHHASGLGVGAAHGMAQTEHALRVELMLGKGLILNICYYRCYFSPDTVSRILSDVKTLLESMADNPERPLSSLLRLIEPPNP